jgi:hypothetical protein
MKYLTNDGMDPVWTIRVVAALIRPKMFGPGLASNNPPSTVRANFMEARHD